MYRLLVVDDEEKIRAIIRKYAEFEGYEITEARDGMEALEICRKEAFRGQEFSSVVTLDGNGMVKKDGSVQEFLRL